MLKIFVGCSMLCEEIKKVMEQLNLDYKILFVDAALHVNLDLLEQSLRTKLNEAGQISEPVILLGTKCHPDIQNLANEYNSQIVKGSNCIELLLGDKMEVFDEEAKTFYLTSGWLRRWRDIFIEGLKWDYIDARQNFGYYDRILLIDTGIGKVADEDILDFFEYTQVPVEMFQTDLVHLRKEISTFVV